MTSAQWIRHRDEMAQSFRQYQRLYMRGCTAAQVVAIEQNWLRLLPSLLTEAEHLTEDATSPDDFFVSLWVRLCHSKVEIQQLGLVQLEQMLSSLTETDSAKLLAIATALHLAQSSQLPLNWQAIAQLCEPYCLAHSTLTDLSWPSEALTQTNNWCDKGLQEALQQLYQYHQADALLAIPDEQLTSTAIISLGLSLQLGRDEAFSRLQSLESTQTEAVFAAYWISGQRDAAELLLSGLRTPHKAKVAARYWALYSGQNLDWIPVMGLVGSDQKQGIKLPDIDLAQQWWQKNTVDQTILWQGKPATNTLIHQALSQYWGRPITPLWALWQFEQHTRLPDPLTQWHSNRLAMLSQTQQKAGHAS